MTLRLGFNIDHIATLRNARGGHHPDPVRGACAAIAAGVDGITAHLREDRRHIRDDDIEHLVKTIHCPLNLEIAPTEDMIAIAITHRPHAVCLVPEKREELTTEGGLDVCTLKAELIEPVRRLNDAGIRVSLFIDPDHKQVAAARETGASVVELHSGTYAQATSLSAAEGQKALQILQTAATAARDLGLECHAGHGLNQDNVAPVAAIPEIIELNIGHFLVGESIFLGLDTVLHHMRTTILEARS